MQINRIKVLAAAFNVLGVVLILITLDQWGNSWAHFLLLLGISCCGVAFGAIPSQKHWRIPKR